MERISIKGVVLGYLTDVGCSIVAGLVLFVVFGGVFVTEIMSPEEVEGAMRHLLQDGGLLIVTLVAGLGFTALGGYVAARVAKQEFYLNAGLVGVVGVLVNILVGGWEAWPLWFVIVGHALMIPAAVFGGHLAERQLTTSEDRPIIRHASAAAEG